VRESLSGGRERERENEKTRESVCVSEKYINSKRERHTQRKDVNANHR